MKKEISAQSLNANPLNWSLTRTTPWQMQPALWMSAFHNDAMGEQLRDERQGKTSKASPITPEQIVTDYIVGYYSALRPHEYNGGLPPNESENRWLC